MKCNQLSCFDGALLRLADVVERTPDAPHCTDR